MNSANSLQSFSRSFQTLSNLQEGERLSVSGSDVAKYRSPDSLVSNSKNICIKVVHHIAKIVLKIIQAIGRLFRGQSTKKDLRTLDGLIDNVSVIHEKHKKDFLKLSSKEFYHTLNTLGQLHYHAEKAVTKGLENYKTTLITGKADFIRPGKKKRALNAKKVEEMSQRIETHIMKPFIATIEQMEKKVFEEDKTKAEVVLKSFLHSKPSEKPAFITVKAARSVVGGLFGEKAFNEAIERTSLSGRRVLSDDELRVVLTSIAANMTMDALETVYRNDNGKYLNIKKKEGAKFSELSTMEQSKILQSIRFVSYQTMKVSPKHPSFAQFNHDKNLLEGFLEIEEYCGRAEEGENAGDLKKFSYAEYLAHDLIYRLFDDPQAKFAEGVLIPFYDKKGRVTLKEAHTLASEYGLHAVTIEPTKVSASRAKERVQVVFRGTSCIHSVRRDVGLSEKEYWYGFEGPGRMSFKRKEQAMIERLQERIDNLTSSGSRKVCLEFMGHSLGGCDSMRKCEAYANYLVQKPQHQHKVYGMNLFAFNAPALESDKVLRFSQNVFKLPYRFKMRYFDAHGDAVQEFGKMRLGYLKKNVEKAQNLHVSIIKSDRPGEKTKISKAKRALSAHMSFVMKKSSTLNQKKKNHVFIESVVTDYEKDSKMHFGSDKKSEAKFLSARTINQMLLTRVGFIAKSIKKARNYITKTLPRYSASVIYPV